MRARACDRLPWCIQSWVRAGAWTRESRLLRLMKVLQPYALRLLRRHGLRDVEACDVLHDVFFTGPPDGLREFLRRKCEGLGIERAERGLLRSLKNAVWRLHQQQDPIGARAFQATRRALHLLTTGPIPAAGGLGFGDVAAAGGCAVETVENWLRTMLAAPAEARGRGLRCPRAMANWLVGVLQSMHRAFATHRLAGCLPPRRLQAVLEGVLRDAARAESDQLLGTEAGGGVRFDPTQHIAMPPVDPWQLVLAPPQLRLLLDLLDGEITNASLRTNRRERLRGVLRRWRSLGAIEDPLPGWLAAGAMAKATVYDDRTMLQGLLAASVLRLASRQEGA